jgi:rhamnogalacturonan endolyase
MNATRADEMDQVSLFREVFADLEVGTASTYPLNAEGEYHVVERTMGRWSESTIHSSWNAGGGGNWKVLEENGRHVMAHTQLSPVGPPMLTTGDPFWGDYLFMAQVRPLSFEGACGLIVRYQNARCYDALRITRGQIALLHRDNGAERRLASRGYAFDVDRYYTVRVACVGPRIAVSVDGEVLLQAREPECRRGKVGFWAEAPARFADLSLSTSRDGQGDARTRAGAWAADERALRAALPAPVLWKSIPTPGFGTDRNLRFGDLDGDGQLEIVLSQRVDLGTDNYPSINCLTAIDLEGHVLWQYGEPSDRFKPATSDNCLQVYDLDGDGCAEVLFCKDMRIWVADGKTGQILRSAPTPRSHPSRASGGRPYERILGDALYICNLSGGPRPQEILIKDRYAHIWALDAGFNELWHRECTTGHFPFSYDVDGDGCDEVMAGYSMLDQDGSLLWELPYGDHQDATAIGPFDRPGELLVGQAAGDEGFILTTAQGTVLAKHDWGHVQKLAVANVRPDLPGLEYVIITFWRQPGITAVFNSRGALLETFELIPYASALTPVNWTCDGHELLFLSAHPTTGGLIDGRGRRAVMFPDDGHPSYCCKSLDLTGDGRDELLTWDTQSIWIYRADAPLPGGRRYRPIRPPLYNESNYMAQTSLPNWE